MCRSTHIGKPVIFPELEIKVHYGKTGVAVFKINESPGAASARARLNSAQIADPLCLRLEHLRPIVRLDPESCLADSWG